MKTNFLLKQLWNERKSNAWLYTELSLVFVVLWYLVDWTYTTARTYYEPLGFDVTDTYLMRLSAKTDKCSTFSTDTLHQQQAGRDVLEVIQRLRRLPEVEAVSISQNSRPYTDNNSGTTWRVDTLQLNLQRRVVSKDFFQVFRYEATDGSGWKKLADALENKKLVVSENYFPRSYRGDRTLMNRELTNGDDSTEVYRIAAVTKKVRYDDFRSNYNDRYAALLLPEADLADMRMMDIDWMEYCIRVRPGTDAGFAERVMKASDAQYSVGNVFILSLRPYTAVREAFNRDYVNQVKTRLWMLAFLLVNIFLGIIGTFWIRTQQRRSQLGLRMALGASRRALAAELNGEGLLLLALAALPALAVCFHVGYAGLTDNGYIVFGAARFLLCTAFTFILMTLMIVAGIGYPARQAMTIAPAEALHEE
ncbi:MAG: FtsX-like permease family protein [Bacteroides sp.]